MKIGQHKKWLLDEVNKLEEDILNLVLKIDLNPDSIKPDGSWESEAFQNHTALTQAKAALDMVRNNLNDLV